MSKKHSHQGTPMSHTKAHHLLNPLRGLILSPKKLARRLGLKPVFSVLELGAGPGYYSIEIARRLTGGKLILVDVQQEMLDMARERLENSGITNVEYWKADAGSVPADNASFDVVFVVAVLGEISDRAACLREARRVLRADGLLSLTEQFGDPDFIPMAEIMKLTADAGFELVAKYGFRFNYTANFRLAH